MPENDIRDYCRGVYNRVYAQKKQQLEQQALRSARTGATSRQAAADIETAAQKQAIRAALIQGMRQFPRTESSALWRAVYEAHVHRKSGLDDAEVIARVISADQSWKKSSGHAFEEAIKQLGSAALQQSGIEIVLQRDLSALIRDGALANEPRDISWLKEQIRASVFDLYTVVHRSNGPFCYGCIQSKTSVRDRVTRDREPSMQAMRSFFWSTAIVLDGDFLRLPKFIAMVNGGTPEYPENGWHGMYVFSDQYTQDRIYPIDLDMAVFREHALKAAVQWLHQRQWLDSRWRADRK